MADFTQLVYGFEEVVADQTDVAAATRLRYSFQEVVAESGFGSAATRLRYAFVEVIAAAPGVGGGYKPIIMSST